MRVFAASILLLAAATSAQAQFIRFTGFTISTPSVPPTTTEEIAQATTTMPLNEDGCPAITPDDNEGISTITRYQLIGEDCYRVRYNLSQYDQAALGCGRGEMVVNNFNELDQVRRSFAEMTFNIFWTDAKVDKNKKEFYFPNNPTMSVKTHPNSDGNSVVGWKKSKKKDCVEYKFPKSKPKQGARFQAEKCKNLCPWVCKKPRCADGYTWNEASRQCFRLIRADLPPGEDNCPKKDDLKPIEVCTLGAYENPALVFEDPNFDDVIGYSIPDSETTTEPPITPGFGWEFGDLGSLKK